MHCNTFFNFQYKSKWIDLALSSSERARAHKPLLSNSAQLEPNCELCSLSSKKEISSPRSAQSLPELLKGYSQVSLTQVSPKAYPSPWHPWSASEKSVTRLHICEPVGTFTINNFHNRWNCVIWSWPQFLKLILSFCGAPCQLMAPSLPELILSIMLHFHRHTNGRTSDGSLQIPPHQARQFCPHSLAHPLLAGSDCCSCL